MTTLASIGDGVITADPEGRVVYLNRVAEALTGWCVADAVGQPLDVVFRILDGEPYCPPLLGPCRLLGKNGFGSDQSLLADRQGCSDDRSTTAPLP